MSDKQYEQLRQVCLSYKHDTERLKKELSEKQKAVDEINKEFLQAIKDRNKIIAELKKELEVYKRALELAVAKVAEYSGDYWQESKDYLDQARKELEEQND